MSLEKRNKGYTVRWRDSGGKQRSQQVTLYRDAIKLDSEMRRLREMGGHGLITHERGTVRLDDFYGLWLERYGHVHITSRTLDGYQALWAKHLAPNLGSVRLRDVTPEHIATLIAKLSRTLSSGSVRKCLAVLQGVLQRAVEWQYIPTNPAAGVRKPRLVSREGVALTAEQLERLVLELPSLRSQIIVGFLAGSGLRPGELRALRWEAVTDLIAVTRAVSGSQVGPTKTNRNRSVELRNELADVLREWSLACGRPSMGLVMAAHDGGVWSDQGWRMWQRQVFAPAAQRAGFAGLVPYDLRHTFASTLIAEGRDIYWIARQMGHSPTMTLTTYGHLFESRYGAPQSMRYQEASR